MASMLYGPPVWDPLLIIAQIVSIQCLFYLGLGLWQTILFGPYIGSLNVTHLFGWRHMSFKTFLGWMTIAANIINAPLGAVYLLWIVERAKKCLDFASTCYFFHFVFCCAYTGFPASLEWWLTNLAGLAIMSLMGEWLCVRREMSDIPISSLRARGAGSSTQMSTAVSGGLKRSDSKSRLLGGPNNV